MAASAWFYLSYVFNKPSNNNKSDDVIEIKEGTSTAEVSRRLEELGAVESSAVFFLYSKLNSVNIKAGIHTLQYNLSVKELANKLSSGEYLLTKVTVPEGKRIEQVAAMMEDRGIFGYNDVLMAAEGYEGRLFPDTYYLARKTNAVEFVNMMVNNFELKTASLSYSEEDLVLASIVEREAVNDSERPLIAGIFKNRLDIGMRLEADPTVLYVNDSDNLEDITPYDATQYTFWQPINFSLYRDLDSPYNTYVYEGLPPEPICSPGLASILAALNPQSSQYYYFLHGTDGKLYPAKDNQEHELNKSNYLK